MTKEGFMPTERRRADGKLYDLAERTARFGESVIAFAKGLPRNPVTLPLIGQLWKEAKELHLIFAAIWRKQ